MGIHPDLAVLLDLVPADLAGGERIDWAAAEALLGTKLPSDYRALLDTYGVGDIGELVILPPLPSDVRGWEGVREVSGHLDKRGAGASRVRSAVRSRSASRAGDGAPRRSHKVAAVGRSVGRVSRTSRWLSVQSGAS